MKFFRRQVHSVEGYELNNFKFKYSRRTPSARKNEWAVHFLDVACIVSAHGPSGGKTGASRSQAFSRERV